MSDAGRAPLSQHYEPYDFTDTTGPGCGHPTHDGDCLCDVKIPEGVTYDAPLAGYYLLATKVQGGVPRTGPELYRWASELLGLHQAVVNAGVTVEVAQAFDALRTEFHENNGRRYRKGLQEDVQELLRRGLTIPTVADFLCVTSVDVVRLFTKGNEVTATPWIEAERMLRTGASSYGVVARTCGLTKQQVDRLAEVIGFEPDTVKNRGEGGGLKITADEYAQVREMREAGVSYNQISKRLGLNKNAVVGICRRRGYFPKVAA